jgi:hypothetical protein
MDSAEMKLLLLSLRESSKQRRRIRRKLLKFIRENAEVFRRDYWMLRKIRGNYLSDLSDQKIIEYCNHYFLGD